MSEFLTRVEIAFYPEYLNYWLRFGTPVERVELDRRRSIAMFEPGHVFGYVRWRANEYGTLAWRFTIIEAREPSLLLSRVPGVIPGAEVLLLMTGQSRVKRALAIIDQLESRGFQSEEVSPAYYRHIHVRLATGRDVRAYAHDQHAAHLAARRVRR